MTLKTARSERLWLLLLVFVALFSGCQRSPEVRSTAYIEAGKRLLAKNDSARALLQFRNAVQLTPGNPEAHFQPSRAYLASQELDRGVASLRKALELNPRHA